VSGFIKNTSNGQFNINEEDTKPHTFDELIAVGNQGLLPL
jgi:hypothetical protein